MHEHAGITSVTVGCAVQYKEICIISLATVVKYYEALQLFCVYPTLYYPPVYYILNFLSPSEAYSVLRNWKVNKQNKKYNQWLSPLPPAFSGPNTAGRQDKSQKLWKRMQLDTELIFADPRIHKLPLCMFLIFGVFLASCHTSLALFACSHLSIQS